MKCGTCLRLLRKIHQVVSQNNAFRWNSFRDPNHREKKSYSRMEIFRKYTKCYNFLELGETSIFTPKVDTFYLDFKKWHHFFLHFLKKSLIRIIMKYLLIKISVSQRLIFHSLDLSTYGSSSILIYIYIQHCQTWLETDFIKWPKQWQKHSLL